jgi:hypothetical protein
MFILLLPGTIVGIYPACGKAPATRQTKGGAASPAGESILTMVFIRAASSGAIKQLRAMHLDIVLVRPDPVQPADKNSLARGFIVEAVVSKDILPKLKAMGFDVYEVHPKDK